MGIILIKEWDLSRFGLKIETNSEILYAKSHANWILA